MKLLTTLAIVVIALLGICAHYLATGGNIPGIGDSEIAFQVRDSRGYFENCGLGMLELEFFSDGAAVTIKNLSPQKWVLQLTDLDTQKTFTVRYRDGLSGSRYEVACVDLDGKVLSRHALAIYK